MKIIGAYVYKLFIAKNESNEYVVKNNQYFGFINSDNLKPKYLGFPFQPRIIMYSTKNYPINTLVNPTVLLKEMLKNLISKDFYFDKNTGLLDIS